MNTTQIKKTAILARKKLIAAIIDKLNHLKVDNPNDLPVIGNKQDSRFREGTLKSQRAELIKRYETLGKNKEQLAEEVAYTWFNRFIALRFMEANGYLPNKELVLSSSDKSRKLPDSIVHAAKLKLNTIDKNKVEELILSNKTEELFKHIIVGYCAHLHKQMPFLFDKIDSYTELLLPDNLLLSDSVISLLEKNISNEDWKEVEIIGWLYQYYISEKKDEVMKSKGKVKPEDIPAVTQLFTPNWIVRYMVQNSLGRLWLQNNPSSKLAEKMEYYIAPEKDSSDYLKVNSPEDIKMCDPAVGSGHILVYAFELLFYIYKEQGYPLSEIPKLIISKNLYGIEIDNRAGQLAGLALLMKAREFDKTFLNNPPKPNICVLENIVFSKEELAEYIKEVGTNLFTTNLHTTLRQFEESDNFGSLIQPAINNVDEIKTILKEKNVGSNLFLNKTHENVLKVLNMADYLSQKYHVVVANPPYLGSLNNRLKSYATDNYPDSKSDLFAMFMERNLELSLQHGFVSMINMQSWMFLSSYEKLREKLLSNHFLASMVHIGTRGFDSIGGEVVSATSFVIEKNGDPANDGWFVKVTEGKSEVEKARALKTAVSDPNCEWFYRAKASDFKKIPGSPIAYWVSEKLIKLFDKKKIDETHLPKFGMSTGDGNRFIRSWFEVSLLKIGFSQHSEDDFFEGKYSWAPLDKGGSYRKWYGNQEKIVLWKNRGSEIRDFPKSAVRSPQYFFKPRISWTLVSSGNFSARFFEHGFVIDTASNCIYSKSNDSNLKIINFLNTNISQYLLKILNPTLNYSCGVIGRLPSLNSDKSEHLHQTLINLSKTDWDSYETSWDFTELPLLNENYRQSTIEETYLLLRKYWQQMTNEVQQLEEENNKIFIDAYGLEDELTPDVLLSEVTLTCNPHYRYKGNKTDKQLEKLLLEDTIKEFVSYAVGCMMGRYSLDKPGLILANQGEVISDYLEQVPQPSFRPDEDGIIPITDADDFPEDDIIARFSKFVSVAFGAETLEENLQFIASVLGKKANETPRQAIRNYFIKDFYKDHVKMYKKRPIYWLLRSGKEKAFGALIYMHRHTPSMFAKVRTQYLHKLQRIIDSAIEREKELVKTATGADKTQAQKRLSDLTKKQTELRKYDELLHIHADTRKKIDLDDGVAANYQLFQDVLEKI